MRKNVTIESKRKKGQSDIMVRNKIRELRQILSEIEKAPSSAGGKELEDIVRKVGASLPTAGMDSLKDKCIQSVHTTLQTEMMVKACVSAKWSCFWAMIAAIAACITVVLTLCVK